MLLENIRRSHVFLWLKTLIRSKINIKIGNNIKVINNGFIYKKRFDIIGNNNQIAIGEGARLYNVKIFMRGDNHVLEIGKNVIIKHGEFWFEDTSCTISIGNETTIESTHIAVTEDNSNITIGNDCMISTNVQIRSGDSHSIVDNNTGSRLNFAKDVKIGNHVWIGTNAMILKGSDIGSNSIVGAASVVSGRQFQSNLIISGIPAKEIKSNIDWKRERIKDQRGLGKN